MARKLCLMAALALFLSFLTEARAVERLRFASPVRDIPYYSLPVFAAEDKGFWKEQGLEVKWIPFNTGTAMHQALAAGEVDTAIVTGTSAVLAISRGLPEVIVADLKGYENYFIFVLPDSPLKSPPEIKGRTLGVTRLAGTTYAYARAMVKALGLERQVKLVGTGGTREMVAALRAKKVDSILTSDYTMAALLVKGETRPLLRVRDYLPQDWTDLLMVASLALVEKRPGVVKGAVAAIIKGAQMVERDPAWAQEKLRVFFGYNEPMVKLIYPASLRYGQSAQINVNALKNVRDFLVEYGVLPKEKLPALERLYLPHFAEPGG